MYNYYEAMENDLVDYINENISYILENIDLESDKEEQAEQAREYIYDNAWISDSVTGNGSGSYTFNSWKAKEYVLENLDLLKETAEEFGMNCNIFEEEWETWDVSIRCYILGSCIEDAIDASDLFE